MPVQRHASGDVRIAIGSPERAPSRQIEETRLKNHEAAAPPIQMEPQLKDPQPEQIKPSAPLPSLQKAVE